MQEQEGSDIHNLLRKRRERSKVEQNIRALVLKLIRQARAEEEIQRNPVLETDTKPPLSPGKKSSNK